MKKILIHACCAPCLCFPYFHLKQQGFEITVLWYNPNIHPYTEYKLRLDTLYKFQALTNVKIIYIDEYNLKSYLEYTEPGWKNDDRALRCSLCYELRIKKLIETAIKEETEYFTTTLLYSKYQLHEKIKEICEKERNNKKVKFYYYDFRRGWKEGIRISKEMGLYRQKYCGCIFSEYERYL